MLGVIGVWRNLPAPSGRSASSMPDAITAPTAMQPASPTPLTPSGLSGDGVSRWSDLDVRHLGRVGDQEIDEVGVERIAVGVVLDPLVHRAADALRDAAQHLALDDRRVDHVAAVVDADVFPDLHRAEVRIDLDDRAVDAIGPGGAGGL